MAAFVGSLFGASVVFAQSVTITGHAATSGYVIIGNASFSTPAVASEEFRRQFNIAPP